MDDAYPKLGVSIEPVCNHVSRPVQSVNKVERLHRIIYRVDINALTADRLANKIVEFIHYQPLKAT